MLQNWHAASPAHARKTLQRLLYSATAPSQQLQATTAAPCRAVQRRARPRHETVARVAYAQELDLQIRSLSSAELDPEPDASHLAYEMIQGPLARWTTRAPGQPAPPTAVLVHGILGSRRNMQSFARMIVRDFPTWQILLVDLRCHGDTARLANRPQAPHDLQGTAKDVLRLLSLLRLFPNMLIGHSFGGKVVMSMVQQFGRSSLPRPVQVWALDTLPGEVRAGNMDGSDRPGLLLDTLLSLPLPIYNRHTVIDTLLEKGFSPTIARWAATNLRPMTPEPGQPALNASGQAARLVWSVDLHGIQQLYQSYEDTSMWPLLAQPPQGLKLDFVKADGSNFRWGGEDEARIHALGHRVHLLRNSGHWVHTDNPAGLLDLLAPSFGHRHGVWSQTGPSRN